MNCRMITGSVIASENAHTLTSESQEVWVGPTVPTNDLDSWRDVDGAFQSPIAPTAIPHSGQLNITNSTLFTTKFSVSVKSEMMSNLFAVCNCNVSRLLAHMSPSSPVSVGILPQNTASWDFTY